MRLLETVAISTLVACAAPKGYDTSWTEDTATPPAELTAEPCEDIDAALTVPAGTTDVPALCLEFTAVKETALTRLLISDVMAGAGVRGRAGTLYNVKEGGTPLSDREEASLGDSSILFDSNLAVNFPANEAYQLWLRVDVGTSAGTYQATLPAPDHIATEPAGLQPGGDYGSDVLKGAVVTITAAR